MSNPGKETLKNKHMYSDNYLQKHRGLPPLSFLYTWFRELLLRAISGKKTCRISSLEEKLFGDHLFLQTKIVIKMMRCWAGQGFHWYLSQNDPYFSFVIKAQMGFSRASKPPSDYPLSKNRITAQASITWIIVSQIPGTPLRLWRFHSGLPWWAILGLINTLVNDFICVT